MQEIENLTLAQQEIDQIVGNSPYKQVDGTEGFEQ